MKKQHKFLTILLVILLCVTLVTTLIACDKDDETTEEVKDSSEIIANGNFEVTTSDTFPKTPGSWTASPGSTSSGNETLTDEKSLVAGVIDTDETVYNKNKKNWNSRLKNPGAFAQTDSNILMIYNKVENSYKYTSNSFSLNANKVYRIDISVKTQDIEGYGAYIKIGGDAFIEFPNINTKGEWTTYSAMIKTSNISSNSVNVVLSNGKDGKNDGYLTKGYAFFDNIVVSEVEKDNYSAAIEKFNEFKNNSEGNIQQDVNDLIYGDTQFINISGTSNPFTARKWTGVSSSGDSGETAPTGSDYLERGIVDFSASNGIPSGATGVNVRSGAKDSKVLMLNNKQQTAYAYRSDSKIKIVGGTDNYYKISVWVLTKDIEGNGSAYMQIKYSTDKADDIKTIDFKNATPTATDGEWNQYSMIIKADEKRSKEIYLQLGFGRGGKDDSSRNVKGTAFFDDVTIEKLENTTGITEDVSLESAMGNPETLSPDPTDSANYEKGYYNEKDGIPESYRGTISSDGGVITVNSDKNAITRFIYNGSFTIKANNHYRFTFKVKTNAINEDKGFDIKFYKKNGSTNNKLDVDLTNSTITNFNTKNVEDSLKLTDDYVEFSFLFQGDLNKDTSVYFEIIMGSGTNLTPDTLVSGSVSLKDFELNKIFYSDYNSESGTYVKKHSFKSETQSITNADFNQIDIAATKTQYEDFDEADFLDGNSKGVFGLPQSWTTSDKEYLNDKLYAGVFNIENTAQKNALNITGDFEMPSAIKSDENKNVLAISSNKASSPDVIDQAWSFTSPSISLSKGKYYELTVFAKITDGNARINLLSSSKTLLETLEVQDGDWNQYIFYINAGFDNSTVYLELKLGDNATNNAYGTVFFDLPKLNELTEDQYETGKKNIDSTTENYRIATTFSTINFDNSTSNADEGKLNSPDGWTGVHNDTDAPSGEYKSIAGVYNSSDSHRDWFGGDGGEGKKEPIPDIDLKNIMYSVPGKDGKEEGDTNSNILVIHNNVASEYTYSTTLADNSLTENKFYEISLYVLTYGVDESKTAKISLKLHNSTYEFSKNDKRGINVNTTGAWKKYSFFIATEDNANIDKVELSVSLGASGKDNYVAGYLFVDNVSISEIDEDRFNTEVPEDKYPTTNDEEENFSFETSFSSIKHRIVFTSDDLNKDPEEETEKETDPLLWLYITSGIVSGLVLIAVAIYLLRKFNIFAKFSKKGNFAEKGNETYNRNRVDANKANAPTRDINKKHQD